MDNARSIISDRQINASYSHFHRRMGVYFTVLGPRNSDYELIQNNYIYHSPKYKSKIQCAIAIKKSDIRLQKLSDIHGRDVWEFSDSVDLSDLEYSLVVRD